MRRSLGKTHESSLPASAAEPAVAADSLRSATLAAEPQAVRPLEVVMLWNRRPDIPNVFTGPLLRCSFCNKSQRDVLKMVAGPEVSICSECVEICQDILAEDRVLSAPDPEAIQRGEDLVSG